MADALPPDLRDALEAFAARVRQRFASRLRFVRLFGSWARGEAHEDSDIDVAVVVEDLTRPEWREAIGDAAEVELATGVILSPVVIAGARFDELLERERRLARDVLREGIAL